MLKMTVEHEWVQCGQGYELHYVVRDLVCCIK